MLELTLSLGGNHRVFHPTAILGPDFWVLVDTGLPGSAEAIQRIVVEAGFPDVPPSAIILTHQDLDHIGGLPGFLSVSRKLPVVYAHLGDQAAIDGQEPLLKASPERVAQLLETMPEQQRTAFENTFIHPTRPNVNLTISDGDTLDFGGGLAVIHTPGHTPGHVALYHQPSKTLLAGDAMVIIDGQLSGPVPAATPNMAEAVRSLSKFKAFDIEQVICYHGGLFQGNANKRIAELADQL